MMVRFSRRLALLLAFPAFTACASVQGASVQGASGAPADAYAGKSVLDAAIAAAGGEAALRQVKELNWTGSAVVNSDGKATELEVDAIVRPPFAYARSTSWPKSEGPKTARTLQAEFGNVWSISRVTWTPMPEPQAQHELQQFSLYSVMLLTPLKDAEAKVQEIAPGKDGTRNLHVEHPSAPPMDLRFDASGKLIRAAYSVRDPKGGPTPIQQVAEFSGELTSNGVKWPKHISIKQNEAPYFDLELATFDARPTVSVKPLEHTLQTPGQPARERNDN